MYIRTIDGFLNNEFIAGVEQFMEFCISNNTFDSVNQLVRCKRCRNRKYNSPDKVKEHIMYRGFIENYYWWNSHGETKEMFDALLNESQHYEGSSSIDPIMLRQNDNNMFGTGLIPI